MGRVSRYKKVKSVDPFAKNGSWKSDVGDCATLRRTKRRSRTALKLKEQKMNKLLRRKRGKKEDAAAAGGRGGGSNGWGDDSGYDLPPEGGDEFDLSDLTGSLKKQRNKSNPLSDTASPALEVISSSTSSRGLGVASDGNGPRKKKQKKPKNAGCVKPGAKKDGTLITDKTPIREIIAACSDPKSQKQRNNDSFSSANPGVSKQEKRKVFLEKKKLKKRKRGGSGALDGDYDDERYANQQALQSLHSQSRRPSSVQTKIAKKCPMKQPNHSDTMIARTAIDDQVERPPVFTSLPRGASKLSKNNKAASTNMDAYSTSLKDEDDGTKVQRIRKEQQALEALREKVIKRYSVLKESRRNRTM